MFLIVFLYLFIDVMLVVPTKLILTMDLIVLHSFEAKNNIIYFRKKMGTLLCKN